MKESLLQSGPPKIPAHLEAVLLRQHHIQKDEVELLFESAAARLGPVGYQLHLIAFEQE
jgi:hypothetical protein